MNLWNRLSKITQRVIKFILFTLSIFLLGMLYYVIVSKLGFGFFCPLYKFFNIQCGTCGLTRMCTALIDFRFKDAFNYNQLYFILSPVIVYLYFKIGYNYIKSGEVYTTNIEDKLFAMILVLTAIFAVFRNFI